MAQPEDQRRFDAEKTAAAAFADFHGNVYRFLLRRSGSHEDAEELTQRVFVEAAIALKVRSAEPQSMLAWLYTIAQRRFIDEARRRATARAAARLVAVDPESAPDVQYGKAAARAIRGAIERLPAEQRVVVVMKIIQGRSFVEIADEVGVSVEACRMRLSRAIASLREDLAGQGFGPDE